MSKFSEPTEVHAGGPREAGQPEPRRGGADAAPVRREDRPRTVGREEAGAGSGDRFWDGVVRATGSQCAEAGGGPDCKIVS